MKVDRAGNFKALVVDHGVGATNEYEKDGKKMGGLAQLLLTLSITEWFDGENWIDFAEYDMSVTAYLVLVGNNGQDLRNNDQVMKVFGWDGKSYAELDTLETIDDTVVMIRVKEDTWNDELVYKVEWLDKEDATPGGGGIKKLDKKALKSLDARFNRKAKSKPAKAKTKATVPKSKGAPPKSKKSDGNCTKDEAYDYLMNSDLWLAKVGDREMAESVLIDLWSKAVDEMGDDEDAFTKDEWFIIREKIAVQIFKF